MNSNNNDADSGASLSNAGLAACPYCGSAAVHYPQNDGQANAIYCTNCPLGVEDNRLDFAALAMVWNNLPRAANAKVSGVPPQD